VTPNNLTGDHLGSPRINTDQNGAVTARHDYYPFGEEIATAQRTPGLNYSGDTVRKQFTGYERDSETDLDFAQARYHNFSLGRFSSPDPLAASAKTVNPQSWNRYIYTLNAPLRFTDVTGTTVGDYYSESGDYLGWDGEKNDNIYVVTDGDQRKTIEKNEKAGKSTAISTVTSAVLLPSFAIRAATGRAVDRTRNPTSDDVKGNRHEEALVGVMDGGHEVVVDAPGGKYSNLADPTTKVAESDALAGLANYNGEVSDITAVVHTHPGGEFTFSPIDLTSSSVSTSLGGGGKPLSRYFDPSPANSPTDFSQAKQIGALFPKAIFVAASLKNNTAYVYNSDKVRATFPLDKFTTVAARKH
jgi:RHS repeat-associated protein